MTRKGWIGAALLLLAGGCGGGGGGYHPSTYVLINGVTEQIPAGECVGLEQPESVPSASTMTFQIDDRPVGVGVDNFEAGVMHAADFNAAGSCDFNLAIVDDHGTGSGSDSFSAPAGTYQFIVGCANVVDPCIFDLTWTATY